MSAQEQEEAKLPIPADIVEFFPTEKLSAVPESPVVQQPIEQVPTRRLETVAMPNSAEPTLPAALIEMLPTQQVAVPQVAQPPAPIAAQPPVNIEWAQKRTRRSNLAMQLVEAHPSLAAFILATLAFIIVVVPLLRTIMNSRSDSQWQPSAISGTGTLPNGKPSLGAINWAAQAENTAELNYVNSIIAHMTLQQEVGQMIMIEFSESQMSPGLAYEISHYNVGSVILYAYNVLNTAQMQQFTQAMQANATLPLLISTDQEGGPVNRLYGIDGYLPSAEEMGATNDPNYARQRGEQDAQALYNLGINANLAPVVDVQNVPDGEGVLGGRMFGTTPTQVTKMAGAYLAGLQSSGHVVGSLKHFPGLGDVPVDPHKQLYTLDRSLSQLRQIDWAPYVSLFATNQVSMVMVTHVVLQAVDPTRPASLSHAVITCILRNQLHFNGVVVTDGIYMKALSQYSFDQVVLYAVEAGVDVISSTYSLASTAEAERVILDAVQNGTISKQQIDDSVRRILLVKLRYGILSLPKSNA